MIVEVKVQTAGIRSGSIHNQYYDRKAYDIKTVKLLYKLNLKSQKIRLKNFASRTFREKEVAGTKILPGKCGGFSQIPPYFSRSQFNTP